MSSLTVTEKARLEDVLEMSGGYVLDFSNRTFEEFVKEHLGTDKKYEQYYDIGSSKAARLRHFWDIEDDDVVGKFLIKLLEKWRYDKESVDAWASESLKKQDLFKYDYCMGVAQNLIKSPNKKVEKTFSNEISKNKIKFYLDISPNTLEGLKYPFFRIIKINWNDFGAYTTYRLEYFTESKNSYNIGVFKILQNENQSTELPNEFYSLDDSYISLGQSVEFYKELLRVSKGNFEIKDVLLALNDISWNNNKGGKFESYTNYRNSLFRDSSAESAYRFGRAIVLKQDYSENFSFLYNMKIEGATSSFDVFLDFDREDKLSGRIVGVIGKNAVGKTTLVSNIANDLVNITERTEESKKEQLEKFLNEKPMFSKVVAVSYSAFDDFPIPEQPPKGYVYCGLRTESNKGLLEDNYIKNLYKIKKKERLSYWVMYINNILGHSEDIIDKIDKESNKMSKYNESDLKFSSCLKSLSSGQSILVHFITAILANIENNSLIIFDEPETHLHPNAIASLFNVFHRVLRDYDSYSIVSTHSPIIIQEIPTKRVIMLERDGNTTYVRPLGIETFGESISELTRHVFDTISIPNYYKEVLEDLSRRNDFKSINNLFSNELSFNAKSYLLTKVKG